MIYRKNYFIIIINCFIFFSFILEIKSTDINQNKYFQPLEKDNSIQKYINKGINDTYQISLLYEDDIKKIFIELMIFSGDAILHLEETNLKVEYHQNANKIFLNITKYKKEDNWPHYLVLNVSALKNSYYSLRYIESKKYLTIPKNTNFLVTLLPYSMYGLGHQTLEITTESESPFFINFNFVNCQGRIINIVDLADEESFDNKELSSKDNYLFEDVIFGNNSDCDVYYYRAQIYKLERGPYFNQRCMLYVSYSELNNDIIDDELFYLKEPILIGENVPQKIIFNNNINQMIYLYQIPDINNDLALKFLMTIKSEYYVDIYIKNNNNNDKILIKSVEFISDHREILKSAEYNNYCIVGEECALILEINKNFGIGIVFELEVVVKSLSKKEVYPSYLIKNKINTDYLYDDIPNYYYTELNNNLYGKVIINYYRGSGMIYGKIVKKEDIQTPNSDWMGVYKFPSTKNGTLPYIIYLKELNFTKKDTSDCYYGCYLLLKVVNNNSLINNWRYINYDISVLIDTEKGKQASEVLNLPLGKYVLGNSWVRSSVRSSLRRCSVPIVCSIASALVRK